MKALWTGSTVDTADEAHNPQRCGSDVDGKHESAKCVVEDYGFVMSGYFFDMRILNVSPISW